MKKLEFSVVILLFVGTVFAQESTIVLKDGRTINGTIVSETEYQYTVQVVHDDGFSFSFEKIKILKSEIITNESEINRIELIEAEAREIEKKKKKPHLNRFYSKYNKSITELLAGAGGAVFLGAVGLNIIEDSLPGESLESGFGMAAGLVLGSSIGVWLAGELMEDKGSLTGAFLGSVAGPALFILVDASLGYPMIGYSVILGSFFSPLGATMGYALSRPDKPPQTGSILNIDNNTAKLEIPSPTIRLSGNKIFEEYKINLVNSNSSHDHE